MGNDEILAIALKALKGGGGGGGTSNYNSLENLPQINGVTLKGDKTSGDLGLADVVRISQAEYDALSSEAKLDTSKVYYVYDAQYATGAKINDNAISTDSLWSSKKTSDEIANAGGGSLIDDTTTAVDKVWSSSKVSSELSDKVDAVSGKGLSANDYTDADKLKLSGIESGAEVNIQSDWNQADSSSKDFIKNKPTIPSQVTVDQTYDGTSSNAQSGTAVAGAISGKADTSSLSSVATSGSYNDLSDKPTIPVVTDTYSSSSHNAMSGVAVASAVSGKADTSSLGTAAFKDVPTSGNATNAQVVMGNDTRLTDSRNAADVSAWAKASTKPIYTASEVGAIPASEKGANGGVATLDSTGKVPSSQLPGGGSGSDWSDITNKPFSTVDTDALPINNGKMTETVPTYHIEVVGNNTAQTSDNPIILPDGALSRQFNLVLTNVGSSKWLSSTASSVPTGLIGSSSIFVREYSSSSVRQLNLATRGSYAAGGARTAQSHNCGQLSLAAPNNGYFGGSARLFYYPIYPTTGSLGRIYTDASPYDYVNCLYREYNRGTTELSITLSEDSKFYMLFTYEYNASTEVYRGSHAYYIVTMPTTAAPTIVEMAKSTNSGVTVTSAYEDDAQVLKVKASGSTYQVDFVLYSM